MRLRQGDTAPAFTRDVGTDLTEAESVRVVGVQGITTVVDDESPTVSESQVTHEWAAGETAAVGRIHITVAVDWGTTQQTFPEYGSYAVDIDATDLAEEGE